MFRMWQGKKGLAELVALVDSLIEAAPEAKHQIAVTIFTSLVIEPLEDDLWGIFVGDAEGLYEPGYAFAQFYRPGWGSAKARIKALRSNGWRLGQSMYD